MKPKSAFGIEGKSMPSCRMFNYFELGCRRYPAILPIKALKGSLNPITPSFCSRFIESSSYQITDAIAPLYCFVHYYCGTKKRQCRINNPAKDGVDFDIKLNLLISFDFFDDFGNKEGEDKQGNREENFKRNQVCPVAGRPDVF